MRRLQLRSRSAVTGRRGDRLLAAAAALLSASALLSAPAAGAQTRPAARHDHAATHKAATHKAATPAALTKAGRWVVDKQGRVVISHGFDIVQKTAPFYANFLTTQDARFLAEEGFTVARIGFIWAAAEPKPGKYDDAYIRKVIGTNNLLAAYGVHTLIDFHQDQWNNRQGGDGAPKWATLGSDNSVVGQYHFQAFWDNDKAADGVGIQTRFIALWGHIAKMIDASPHAGNVIGYDPLNEPYPGSATGCSAFLDPCPKFEAGQLSAFYRRVIAAIRATGDRHIIWPEGPASQQPSKLATFHDSLIGYNDHYYCQIALIAGFTKTPLTPAQEQECAKAEKAGLGAYAAAAKKRGEPDFLSEFGCSDDAEDTARVVDIADAAFSDWAIWTYQSQDCPGIRTNDSKPGSPTNAKLQKLAGLAVPYAQLIAGTPQSYAFNRSTKTMTLTYSTSSVPGAHLAKRTPTVLFVPRLQYPAGYRLKITGATARTESGGQRVDLTSTGRSSRVTVTVSPRS